MRARPTSSRPWLPAIAGCALLAGNGAVAQAAAQDPPTPAAAAAAAAAAATEPEPASQATPLFTVPPAPVCKAPMCYWSRSNAPVTLIYTKTHMVILDPDVVDTTRGIAHITADRADETGTDPANSQWVFSGNVHFDSADGQLRANTATVQIVDQQVSSVTAQGSPVLFQRLATSPLTTAGGSAAVAPATGATGATAGNAGTAATASSKNNLANLTIHGHAQSITYDATHDRVQFLGDSWFTDGCNEITGERVTYNMATQTVQAGAAPGSQARVHGTVRNTHPGGGAGCTAGGGSTPARPSPQGSSRAPARAGTDTGTGAP